MAFQPPITTVELTGLFLCSIAYGIYLVTYGLSLHSLLRKRTRDSGRCSRNYLLLVMSILVFALLTLKIAIAFQGILQAFASYTGPGGSLSEFLKALTAPMIRSAQVRCSNFPMKVFIYRFR